MKYLVNIEYDGSELNGYATQPNRNTVQDNVEDVLSKVFKEDIKTFGASRTDARVHARDQYFSFETDKQIDVKGICRALNAMTKPAINVKSVKLVADEFNPRYDVIDKEYHYVIMKEYDPFMRRYAYYHKYALDLVKMQEATSAIIGTHDFTSFCNVNTDVIDKVRTVYDLKVVEEENLIKIIIRGNGFLYNMVRIIAGVLIDCGSNKASVEDVRAMLAAKNRKVASKTMPAEGLYLMKINYEGEKWKNYYY